MYYVQCSVMQFVVLLNIVSTKCNWLEATYNVFKTM